MVARQFTRRLVVNLATAAALTLIAVASINAQPATRQATTARPPVVNVNTASLAQLCYLPQVGEVRAAAIVAGRPFKTAGELGKVKGIGKGARLASMLPFVAVSGATTATGKIVTCKVGETGPACQARVGSKWEVIQFANGARVVEVKP